MLVNILLNSTSDYKTVKIVDFGLSAEFSNQDTKILSNKCGTILYMAPEFSKEQTYSKVIKVRITDNFLKSQSIFGLVESSCMRF